MNYSLMNSSFIEDCHVNTSSHHITVECIYHSTSVATGFQMIVQSGILDKAHKVYTNRTVNCHTLATVEVEESGLYLVSILPILKETGITDSSVEYGEMVTVQELDAPTSEGGK